MQCQAQAVSHGAVTVPVALPDLGMGTQIATASPGNWRMKTHLQQWDWAELGWSRDTGSFGDHSGHRCPLPRAGMPRRCDSISKAG